MDGNSIVTALVIDNTVFLFLIHEKQHFGFIIKLSWLIIKKYSFHWLVLNNFAHEYQKLVYKRSELKTYR